MIRYILLVLRYILLVLGWGLAGTACQQCKRKPLEQPPLLESSKAAYIPHAFQWANPNKGDLKVGEAMINDATDGWLNQLKVDKSKKKIVIVNASNENITKPGGGLDGALATWAKNNKITPWTKPAPQLPSGGPAPTVLSAGQFAVAATNFGDIYLAVGPRPSGVATLAKLVSLLENLYFNMLSKAEQDKRKHIILPAISTKLFAGAGVGSEDGKAFSEEEFVDHVYQGMHKGIEKFRADYPGHGFKIILNNWEARVTSGLESV
jgi:hypothetical protein